LLSPQQMNDVHHYSIRILEDTGIQVESKTAQKIFEKSDAVNIWNGVVYIQGELINHAINQAPSNIEVYNKKGDFILNPLVLWLIRYPINEQIQ